MRKYTPLICKDCPTEIFADVNMVMIKDELWIQICDKKEDAYCDCCMEKRLGRKITEQDFKTSSLAGSGLPMIPCNAMWLWYKKTMKKMNIKIINREEGKKALDDGFCVVFGEKHRALFEAIGEKLIELGMKNAEEWCHNLLFYKADRLSSFFEMAEDGIFEKEKIDDIIKGLKVFFSDEEIEKIKKRPSRYEEYAGAFAKGRNECEAILIKEISEEDVTFKNPKPFDYFKQFGLSDQIQFKSVTLHGEGGLGLDQYKPSTMKYYKEEDELFYPIEDIGRKYHYFGMLLKKQEILLYWVHKILKNMTHETNYFVQGYLKNIIYQFSLESVSDEIMLYIQNELNISNENSGFRTHKQIHESLKKIK